MLWRLLRAVLFALPAELAHHVGFGALRFFMGFPLAKSVARALFAPSDPALSVRALGLSFPSPVGLAAGFDKDARGHDALGALGFGFVEVGTLTPRAQPGNPTPRLFRLPADRALLNRLGFNNGGMDAALPRLARSRATLVGLNIGKNKDVSEQDAAADFAKVAERLAPHADYVVVNVSSPNTPGLRALQSIEKLRPVLAAVRAALPEGKPLLVKIAPDLSDEDVDAVADLALELGLEGILATNTTLSRDGLVTPRAEVDALGAGGLSGAPLKARALAVLRRLRARTGDRLVLVSVGGIEDADDAWARIRAGATLVQLYTGFIYGGPLAPGRIARGLLERARAGGFARVQDAIGTGEAP